MKEAELPATSDAWKKAIVFLQRTQNNSETNDQKWAANDGGFVYYPGFTYHVDGGTKSYGSVSYIGLLSYTWANVKKDDDRVKAVVKWIRSNYTVDENPGTGQKTVYYYYMVFARALQARLRIRDLNAGTNACFVAALGLLQFLVRQCQSVFRGVDLSVGPPKHGLAQTRLHYRASPGGVWR